MNLFNFFSKKETSRKKHNKGLPKKSMEEEWRLHSHSFIITNLDNKAELISERVIRKKDETEEEFRKSLPPLAIRFKEKNKGFYKNEAFYESETRENIWRNRAYSNIKKSPNSALKYFDLYLKNNPKDFDAILGKAEALLNLKRYEEALECYNQVIKNNNYEDMNETKDFVFNKKAMTLLDLFRYKEALDTYDAFLKNNPKNEMIIRNRDNLIKLIKNKHLKFS